MLKLCFSENGMLEAGADEAGRGCLAGPVYAAAVILPEGFKSNELNDSKKLSEKQRNKLRIQIEEEAIAWSVASVSPKEIDEINILRASFLAMHKAIAGLNIKPELLLIDGNRFIPYQDIDHQCIIKGDGIYLSIAAASVLAKTHRDEFMLQLHAGFSEYGWDQNKGYPTLHHRRAILEHGQTIWHRKTFRVSEQLKLEL
ncbi:MAG: ribonuclease HII [Bacteroidetes bacterium HGW-Bacteroidetes-9]|jgi:ribonuclease HII|nr:MAG: ribonuclease HII [Bacteroidetes bacterium HGW-Bacteroidetes-9]